MRYNSVWALHSKIFGLIWYYAAIAIYWKNRKRTGWQIGAAGTHPRVTNGPISSSARLGCALRYFPGGCPIEIMVNFGIGFIDVFVCVWSVVMVVNHLPEFYMLYAASHEKQREIAASFFKASSIGFDNCAGAIDGMLVWTHMAAEKDVVEDIG
jgi:hypothetical protein